MKTALPEKKLGTFHKLLEEGRITQWEFDFLRSGYFEQGDTVERVIQGTITAWMHRGGELEYIIGLVQDGAISCGKAVQSIQELTKGKKPLLPEPSETTEDAKQTIEDILRRHPELKKVSFK